MIVPLKEIKVASRFRTKFVDIDKLADSIREFGLIEPIVIDEDYTLIAGERRYKAHQMLKLETIECKMISELDDLRKKEIEFEENIQRNAFTWQEEVTAKSQLHKLKQKIHGEAIKGHGSEGWGMRDTANALSESLGSVSMDIQLARGMKAFPELMKEKSKTIAYKKLKQKQESILQAELSKRLKEKGITDNPDVINGDCLEILKTLKAESIDLILTDPPYGIDVDKAHTFGKLTGVNTHFEDGDFETFDLLDKLSKELYRVLKSDRHMYIFCGIDKFSTIKNIMEKVGFDVHHLPLIWNKGSGSYPSQQTTFTHSYEAILHISKGRRKLNGSPCDIFTIKRVPSERKIHPTEKPCELLRSLIELSTLPGEIILDPFAGSGSTIVAAKECNRRAIGIELNPVYHENITKRLKNGNSMFEVLEDETEDD